jgi:hypothetical protein
MTLALKDLNRGNPKGADQHLASIENGVQINFSDLIEEPVHQKAGTVSNGQPSG